MVNVGEVSGFSGIFDGDFVVHGKGRAAQRFAVVVKDGDAWVIALHFDEFKLLGSQVLADFLVGGDDAFLLIFAEEGGGFGFVIDVNVIGGAFFVHHLNQGIGIAVINLRAAEVSAELFFVIADEVFDEAAAGAGENAHFAVVVSGVLKTAVKHVGKVIGVHVRQHFRRDVHGGKLLKQAALDFAEARKLAEQVPAGRGVKVVLRVFKPGAVRRVDKAQISGSGFAAAGDAHRFVDTAVIIHADDVFFFARQGIVFDAVDIF